MLKKYYFEITDYITGEKRVETINGSNEKDAACFLTEVACDNLWLDELKLLKVENLTKKELISIKFSNIKLSIKFKYMELVAAIKKAKRKALMSR